MADRKWQGMNWIRKEKRLAIYLRDGLACCYCGKGVEDGTTLTLDHVIPHSYGGNNTAENLITCCSLCNSSRGNKPLEKFIEIAAAYYNLPAHKITAHIINCLAMDIDVKQAKTIIAKRGNFQSACTACKQGV